VPNRSEKGLKTGIQAISGKKKLKIRAVEFYLHFKKFQHNPAEIEIFPIFLKM
jgi:hypothetical protein